MKKFNFLDKICLHVDQVVKTLCHTPMPTRPTPAEQVEESASLSKEEVRVSAGLMRINHTGEVCAQALYHGQSITARLPTVRQEMENCAKEEYDHLEWCKDRLTDLNSHTSFLNPLWYAGSFAIGALAGAIGDKWSLGFVAETERQVVLHLESHQNKLPAHDTKSQAVIAQMKIEEEAHRATAYKAGASELPQGIKLLMKLMSKAMTKTVYYV